MKTSLGFTLLEVLVSLAIFALVTLAIGQFTQIQLMSWTILEEKALGEIVAVSAMERVRTRSLQTFTSRVEIQQEIAGMPLHVVTHINETDINHYLAITVEIFRSKDGAKSGPILYQLLGARYANIQK